MVRSTRCAPWLLASDAAGGVDPFSLSPSSHLGFHIVRYFWSFLWRRCVLRCFWACPVCGKRSKKALRPRVPRPPTRSARLRGACRPFLALGASLCIELFTSSSFLAGRSARVSKLKTHCRARARCLPTMAWLMRKSKSQARPCHSLSTHRVTSLFPRQCRLQESAQGAGSRQVPLLGHGRCAHSPRTFWALSGR